MCEFKFMFFFFYHGLIYKVNEGRSDRIYNLFDEVEKRRERMGFSPVSRRVNSIFTINRPILYLFCNHMNQRCLNKKLNTSML